MRNLLKKAATLAAAGGIAAAGLAATAVPASAASYNGACGSGYGVVNKVEFPDNRGTTFLTYNNSNGYNCVVTVRTNPGGAAPMEAFIRVNGTSSWKRDSGDYTTYAGPVYLSAAGRCVDWGGTIGTITKTVFRTNCG
ncbi:spore-associated protein A [Nocardiopsis dassonvillei]|uniref:spore-associated protein A n=1 Tax=Nocardiopsis dassonvillei TaxID=2014 RepID=UPI0020A46405|nr:spore-associated protein A [Nocardiopsis dassonvillei]MCP3012757.1 spore-associated protein A [Nocardiopsis dassonvillei]